MAEKIYETKQMTGNRAVIVYGQNENIMTWTGLDSVVNVSSSPMDTFNFPSVKTQFKTLSGPSLVMFPSGGGGYLIWTAQSKVDGGYQIYCAEVQRGADGKLVVSTTSQEVISAVSLDGIIAAMLGTQNGQLVINLAWRDPREHLCLTQFQPWKKIQTGWMQIQLDQKASSGPAMTTINGRPIMTYFDENKHLNILLAPRNTINFDTHNRLIFKEISSKFAPAMVIQSAGIGYVFWVDGSDSKLAYNQIGMNSRGSVVLNTQVEGSGKIKDAVCIAAPSARMVSREQDDRHVTLLQVVWPQSSKGDIKVAEFEPHYTALT